LVKDENCDLLADSHNILNNWKNYLSQLLNVYRVSDVRQMEIHSTESLVPEPSPVKVEIDMAKLKRYKSPGVVQILAGVVQAGGKTLRFEIHKLIKNCLSIERSLLLYQFTRREIKLTVVIIRAYCCPEDGGYMFL
jgi:hypothetical protein